MMIKKIIFSSLSIILIILFFVYFMQHISKNSAEVIVTGKSEAEFLSDAYFADLDKLFREVKIKNDKWYIFDGSKKVAAEAVIHQMMSDLEKNPDALVNHKNFNQFFETFDQNVRELDDITEDIHFFRNTLNAYSGAPDKLDDMLSLAASGKWKLFSAKFHKYNYEETNGALNVKFLSADGRFEAVYNRGSEKMVVDPANMGTYNYAPGSLNPIAYYKHNKYDKKPWEKWGNIKGFSYEDIIHLKSEYGSDKAKKNDEEIEKLIEQRKSEDNQERSLQRNIIQD